MNIRNAMITTFITAGLISSAVYADDVNTAIQLEPSTIRSASHHSVNPKITIQHYVAAARKKENSSNAVSTAKNSSRWQHNKTL